MNIIRKQELDVDDMNEIRVGDQIQVGKYTATCQKVTDETVIFLGCFRHFRKKWTVWWKLCYFPFRRLDCDPVCQVKTHI